MKICDGIENVETKIDSFLMLGQSNMAGRGDFGEVDEIENKKCYMLRMGRWQPMSEPINPDRRIFGSEFHSGISLAASFADSYSKQYNKEIGLIPCADGGTKIIQWQPDGLLFDHAIMQAKLAMRTSKIKGVLWHQGESDCMSGEGFELYEERLTRVITQMRKELEKPDLIVIMGELSYDSPTSLKSKISHNEFNQLLSDISKKIDNTAVVSAKDLQLKKDGLHFDSKSLREFGVRYFEEYLKIKNTI